MYLGCNAEICGKILYGYCAAHKQKACAVTVLAFGMCTEQFGNLRDDILNITNEYDTTI